VYEAEPGARDSSMSRAAVSMTVFGVYMVALGSALMIAPNFVLAIVRLPPTHEVWLHATGFVVGAIGYYYLRAAREEARGFFRSTVHMRLLAPVAFGVFVLARLADPMLLLFAAVDCAGALWTAAALARDARGK
jgi:hypothetical protein